MCLFLKIKFVSNSVHVDGYYSFWLILTFILTCKSLETWLTSSLKKIVAIGILFISVKLNTQCGCFIIKEYVHSVSGILNENPDLSEFFKL